MLSDSWQLQSFKGSYTLNNAKGCDSDPCIVIDSASALFKISSGDNTTMAVSAGRGKS
jgi:hypothetical protein